MSYQIEILLIHPKYSPTGSYQIKSLSIVLTFNILSPLLTAFLATSDFYLFLKHVSLHLRAFAFVLSFLQCFYLRSLHGWLLSELISEGGVIILELFISFIGQGK